MKGPARAARAGVPAEGPVDAPSEPSVSLVTPPSRRDRTEAAVGQWRAALVAEAGGSARSDIDLLAQAALDLSAAHPSGMAQLYAGRPTRLSNLVREGGALSAARRRARAVSARAAESTQRYGTAATSLAIGVATWTDVPGDGTAGDDVSALATATAPAGTPAATAAAADPGEAGPDAAARTVRVPVLLRPVTVQPRGSAESDYELTLEPTIEVNPVLARALRARGALLDAESLAAGTFDGGGFDPRPALHRLTLLGEAVLPDFELTERRVVGAFVHPGQGLVDDLDALGVDLDQHELLAALAGDDDARALVGRDLPAREPGDRDLRTERGVGDLDDAQRHVLDVVASGAHVFVDAPTGSDVTGTVAALVADAAAAGRTVLYVPGSRRGTAALVGAMTALGLGDLLLDVPPDAGWRPAVARRLLGAMTLSAPESADPGPAADAVTGLRDLLAGYVQALHARREPWEVSAYDVLQQLAAATAPHPAPRTTARLTPDAARVIDADRRAQLGEVLRRAGELGAFTVGPQDTAWFGADLHTDAEATVALHRVERLADTGLPVLAARAAQVAAETGLRPADTVDAWAEQLQMLDEVRSSLDIFLPLVFERSPADLVAATAAKAWRTQHGVTMGFWVRRRLRRQARDMVRPGRPVADLHAALRDVQARREVWRAHCPAGGWPRLPDGLETVETEFAAVRRDVEALDAVLPAPGARLSALPLPELAARLARLRADASSLVGLPERTTLLAGARAAGLSALIADLGRRRVPPQLAPAELELAWWSTVFEQILAADPALAGYDGAALDALSAQYAAADRALVEARPAALLHRVVDDVQGRLRTYRDQGEALFGELVEESLGTLREASGRYPDVLGHLRPVLAASPMLVPQVLPPTRTVDLVVLDAVGHLPMPAAVPAIARGRQVVVVGDPRCASSSAVHELAQVLPTVTLVADGARRDPHLTAFLAAHGYADALRPVPLPDATPLVHLRLVDGTGMPDQTSGVVDSTRAEVEAVVELVLEHALVRPEESLAVVTATTRHADAVRDAVLSEVRGNPGLAAFFDVGRTEPFVVVALPEVAGLSRDAVLLSLGLGRTPHGRVLHSFGVVSAPGGDALLLAALGSCRHRLDVVSCFGADDLDQQRVRGAGPQLLADLLAFAARRGDGRPAGPDPDDRLAAAPTRGDDSLLLDIAERLWRHGLDVELDHGLPGGVRIPLVVGHPAMPGRHLVAVLTDDETYVAEPSVRARDRLAADRLTALGWSVVRVWSAAAFLDPQAEVDRVRRAVHALLPARLPMPVTRTVPLLPDDPADVVVAASDAEDPAAVDRDAAEPDAAEPQTVEPADPADPDDPAGLDDLVAGGPDAPESAGPAGAAEPDDVPAEGAPPDPDGPAADAARPGPVPPTRRLTVAEPRRPRPDVREGLPIGAYSDDQLDDLVTWIRSDGRDRTRDQLADDLRTALGITRRSLRVDAAVRDAVTRALT